MIQALFPIGQIVITPGADRLLARIGVAPSTLLIRHQSGDWGDLDRFDKAVNDYAVRDGQRILSNYTVKGTEKVWIITEWDRSVTTILLPDEY